MPAKKAGGVAELLRAPQVAVTRRIEFVRATRNDDSSSADEGLKGVRITRLVPPSRRQPTTQGDSAVPSTPASPTELPTVKAGWDGVRPSGTPGSGLQNLGNTCFMNATLQCLTHTPPLARFLLSEESAPQHHPGCGMRGDSCRGGGGSGGGHCMLCTLRQHVKKALGPAGTRPFPPSNIVAGLKKIWRTFRPGRQEDSHECLRFVLEAVDKACRAKQVPQKRQGEPAVDDKKPDTVVSRIFGGKLLSTVTCEKCGKVSETRDSFLDLNLELVVNRGLRVKPELITSVEHALRHWSKPEQLSGSNKYLCSGCKARVKATKALAISTAPLILTLQLKRFFFTAFGRSSKVDGKIDFPVQLVVPTEKEGQVAYDLYGVLVHDGRASNCGHYYAFVKSPGGQWYQADDDLVTQVSAAKVLNQRAYILFYQRSGTKPATSDSPVPRKSVPVPSRSTPAQTSSTPARAPVPPSTYPREQSSKRPREAIVSDDESAENDESPAACCARGRDDKEEVEEEAREPPSKRIANWPVFVERPIPEAELPKPKPKAAARERSSIAVTTTTPARTGEVRRKELASGLLFASTTKEDQYGERVGTWDMVSSKEVAQRRRAMSLTPDFKQYLTRPDDYDAAYDAPKPKKIRTPVVRQDVSTEFDEILQARQAAKKRRRSAGGFPSKH